MSTLDLLATKALQISFGHRNHLEYSCPLSLYVMLPSGLLESKMLSLVIFGLLYSILKSISVFIIRSEQFRALAEVPSSPLVHSIERFAKTQWLSFENHSCIVTGNLDYRLWTKDLEISCWYYVVLLRCFDLKEKCKLWEFHNRTKRSGH